MKVQLFGKKSEEIRPLVEKAGFQIVEDNPEIVIAYGGDGTFVRAAHALPGIPKVLLRGSEICKLCPPFSNEEVLRRLKEKKFEVVEILVLEAQGKNKTLLGINDIIVHNKDPRHAIRYRIEVDREDMGHEAIGDGIVVATPLGSTGYYRSITASFFDIGIGLAFNNSTEQFNHMVLGEGSEIRVKITRGPAEVYADNQSEQIELHDGDEVVIKKSKEVARIVTFT